MSKEEKAYWDKLCAEYEPNRRAPSISGRTSWNMTSTDFVHKH